MFVQRFRKFAVPILFFVFTAAFMLNLHVDIYAGLDVAMYARMAEAFARGEKVNGTDTAFEPVPDEVRPLLLYRDGGRLTRDGVFEIDLKTCDTKPFFIPTLPVFVALAGKAGIGLRWFMPLLGVVWLCVAATLRVAGDPQGRRYTYIILFFATAWPVWFLRGFNPEAAGALCLGIAIMLKFGGEKKSVLRDYYIGLLLGLAVSLHLSLCVIALPVALCAILRDGDRRRTLALALGGGVGTLPLLLITKYVCQPYGDFFDREILQSMWQHPVLRATLFAAGIAAFACFTVVALAHNARIRNWFANYFKKKNTCAKLRICVALAVLAAASYFVGWNLRGGAVQTFSGAGWGFAAFAAVAFVFVWDGQRRMSDKVLLVLLCAVSLVFVYINGEEVNTRTMWSQRRFAPVVICLVSLLATTGFKLQRDRILLASAGVFALVNFWFTWPAFTVSDGRGGEEVYAGMERVISAAGENALVVFDYFPHSFPHQRRGRDVFGINEHVVKRGGHAPVLEWMAGEAENGRVVLYVSSHEKPALPEGVDLNLVEIGANNGACEILRGKSFKGAVKTTREIRQKIYILLPNPET